MKVLRYWLCAVSALAMIASCEELGKDPQLIIDPVEDAFLDQTVGSETLSAEGVTFTTAGAWTSQVVPVSTKASQPMWVSISPDHGDEAGTYTLTITLEANETGEDRKANIIISCGGQTITITITQVATPDVPSQGEVQTPQYKKYVSKLEWDFTDYDGEVENDVLTFGYDDKNRIVRMNRNYSSSEDDWERNEWTFNYAKDGEVKLTGTDANSYYGSLTYTLEATLDKSGRVSKYVVAGDDGGYLRYEYNKDGYLSAYIYGGYDDGDAAVESGMRFIYTDGLWTAIQYFSNDGGYKEYAPEEAPYLSTMYASHYQNDKINVDLNPFILAGDFRVEEELIWLPVRLCGKFTDCLMEIGGVYDEDDVVAPGGITNLTTPNAIIPVEYTIVKVEVPETGNPVVWTLDADGCPLTAVETFMYQEYKVTYNIVVGDVPIGERPSGDVDEDGNEIMVYFYDYTTTEKVYTKTENSWSCNKVLTVTYRE